MRRGALILSTVLVTAGLVLALEVGLTIAWSEPVSNYEAWLAQKDATDELERLERDYERAEGGSAGADADADAAPERIARFAERIKEGQGIGRVQIPAIDLNIVAVEGTDTESLSKGPGHYPETVLPGQPGTTAFAGHRTTYLAPFRNINRLDRGDRIVVRMPYGTYTYEFERQRIVNPSQVGVVRDVDHDRIVLTACHPLYSAAERIVVFARLISVNEPGEAQAAAEISPPGLGPTLAGVLGLLPIAILMWFWGGRRPDEEAAL